MAGHLRHRGHARRAGTPEHGLRAASSSWPPGLDLAAGPARRTHQPRARRAGRPDARRARPARPPHLRGDRKRRRRADDLGERGDILSLLLRARTEDGEALTDHELRDELLTLVLAGLRDDRQLARLDVGAPGAHPDAYERLREAVRADARRRGERRGDDQRGHALAPGDPDDRPPRDGAVAARRVRGARAGTPISMSILLLHHREDLYPDPFAFRPERWLGPQARDLRVDPVRRRHPPLPRRGAGDGRAARRARGDGARLDLEADRARARARRAPQRDDDPRARRARSDALARSRARLSAAGLAAQLGATAALGHARRWPARRTPRCSAPTVLESQPRVLTDYHVHLRPDALDATAAEHSRRRTRALPRGGAQRAESMSWASQSTSTASARRSRSGSTRSGASTRTTTSTSTARSCASRPTCGWASRPTSSPGREDRIANLLDARDFDYVIGSVHFVGERAVDIDEYERVGRRRASPEEVWRAYFRDARRGRRSGLFDVARAPRPRKDLGPRTAAPAGRPAPLLRACDARGSPSRRSPSSSPPRGCASRSVRCTPRPSSCRCACRRACRSRSRATRTAPSRSAPTTTQALELLAALGVARAVRVRARAIAALRAARRRTRAVAPMTRAGSAMTRTAWWRGAAGDRRRRDPPRARPRGPLRRRRARARGDRRAARRGGLGDIGEHFPDTDERCARRRFDALLAAVVGIGVDGGHRDRQRRLHRRHGAAEARRRTAARSASGSRRALGLRSRAST